MHQVVAGRFQLIEQIGRGRTGTVWRARDRRRHRRTVAAKVLSRRGADEVLGFVREQTLRVAHPHVVAPHGWAADDGVVVLAMDLVRGGSLDQLLAAYGALPQAYVAVLLDQVLQALDAVHRAGLVHRDVKPANLLLEPTGTGRPHLRLADFGVAVETSRTRGAEAAGTDGYLAPDQAAGAPPDLRQDLFAAGMTAAELLTGRLPAAADDLPPGPLRPVLRALVAAAPDQRPPSAAAALDLLRRTGVPEGAPWLRRPHPPDVPDRHPERRSGLGTWLPTWR
ncbi:serine/threonine-protein kinase [Nocardioides cynanchi]|uniref:serine/threonine-protein kinase n=1 Tax=Nocardioides cynanchi TaxID=2558918 RepID=UPI001244BBC9|nr:serine/threonine-protein kinase [Nocardioides cynanchi]